MRSLISWQSLTAPGRPVREMVGESVPNDRLAEFECGLIGPPSNESPQSSAVVGSILPADLASEVTTTERPSERSELVQLVIAPAGERPPTACPAGLVRAPVALIQMLSVSPDPPTALRDSRSGTAEQVPFRTGMMALRETHRTRAEEHLTDAIFPQPRPDRHLL